MDSDPAGMDRGARYQSGRLNKRRPLNFNEGSPLGLAGEQDPQALVYYEVSGALSSTARGWNSSYRGPLEKGSSSLAEPPHLSR